eukprot:350820-Chlamydomonas_euryale.AAC.3
MRTVKDGDLALSSAYVIVWRCGVWRCGGVNLVMRWWIFRCPDIVELMLSRSRPCVEVWRCGGAKPAAFGPVT